MTGAAESTTAVDDLAGNAYPAMLRDLADVVARQLEEVGIDKAQARAIGESLAEHVRQHYGGQLMYFPMGASF